MYDELGTVVKPLLADISQRQLPRAGNQLKIWVPKVQALSWWSHVLFRREHLHLVKHWYLWLLLGRRSLDTAVIVLIGRWRRDFIFDEKLARYLHLLLLVNVAAVCITCYNLDFGDDLIVRHENARRVNLLARQGQVLLATCLLLESYRVELNLTGL